MERQTKILLVVSGALIAAGVAAWLLNRSDKPPVKDKASDNAEDKPKGETTAQPTGSSNPTSGGTINEIKDAVKNGVKVATTKAEILKADDVLSSNKNSAMRKPLYSLIYGATIYNMANSQAGKTKKNQFLGTITDARESGGGYVITFMNKNVRYWVQSSGMGIRIN